MAGYAAKKSYQGVQGNDRQRRSYRDIEGQSGKEHKGRKDQKTSNLTKLIVKIKNHKGYNK